jgi:RND family efflux transporter MFP subunit
VYSSGSSSGFSFRLSGLEAGTYSASNFVPGKLGNNGLFIEFTEGLNYNDTTWIVPVPNTRSTTYSTRKANYENALATREQVVANAENQLERVTASSANTSRAEAQLQRAEAQVNAVFAQLRDGRITAPFDGVVARNDLEIGEIVSAFTPLITIFGSEERELKLNVPEIYINKIEENDSVVITLDAYPDETFTGSVRSIDIIDTIVDGVPVYETVVIFDDQDPRVRVGMNAKAQVTSDSRTDVIAIPQHYSYTRDGVSYVILKEAGELQEQMVSLGFEGNDGLVEVLEGLVEGQEIVRPSDLEGDDRFDLGRE